MNKNHIAATIVRDANGITPGRIDYTLLSGLASPLQVTVEYLDPAITMGALILHVSDLRSPAGWNTEIVGNAMFMMFDAVAGHVAEVIGAGPIDGESIEWIFATNVLRFINENVSVRMTDNERLTNAERKLLSDVIFDIHKRDPADVEILRLESVLQ